MKPATKILSLFVMIGLATFYMGCDKGDGDDQTEEEIQLGKLVGTWNLTSAVDNSGQRTDFVDMQLTLSGTYKQDGVYSYLVTGTLPDPSPWPKDEGRTWKFRADDPTSFIVRDPTTDSELDMEYTISDDGNTLQFIFTVPDDGGWEGGRTENVTGNWTFVFDKQ